MTREVTIHPQSTPVQLWLFPERWDEYGIPAPERCGDCGCEPGATHHAHCDIEVCPICGGQLLGCDGMGYHVGLPGVTLYAPGPPYGGLRRVR